MSRRRRSTRRIRETPGARALRLELEAAAEYEERTIMVTDPKTGDPVEYTGKIMTLPPCGSKEAAIASVTSTGAFGRRR